MSSTRTQSYWNGTGKYEALYRALHSQLVPSAGASETFHGEILRVVSKLYYDHFNNGACNFDVYKDIRVFLWSCRSLFPAHVRPMLRRFISTRRRCGPVTDQDRAAFDSVVDATVQLVAEHERRFGFSSKKKRCN